MTWQPINTAPKNGTLVLLYSPDAGYPGITMARWLSFDYPSDYVFDGWYDIWGNGVIDVDPTHWVPLLEPPISAAHS
jgi:hypothetical protein